MSLAEMLWPLANANTQSVALSFRTCVRVRLSRRDTRLQLPCRSIPSSFQSVKCGGIASLVLISFCPPSQASLSAAQSQQRSTCCGTRKYAVPYVPLYERPVSKVVQFSRILPAYVSDTRSIFWLEKGMPAQPRNSLHQLRLLPVVLS